MSGHPIDTEIDTTDLGKIIKAWPTLPEPIRRAMLALIGRIPTRLTATAPSKLARGRFSFRNTSGVDPFRLDSVMLGALGKRSDSSPKNFQESVKIAQNLGTRKRSDSWKFMLQIHLTPVRFTLAILLESKSWMPANC